MIKRMNFMHPFKVVFLLGTGERQLKQRAEVFGVLFMDMGGF